MVRLSWVRVRGQLHHDDWLDNFNAMLSHFEAIWTFSSWNESLLFAAIACKMNVHREFVEGLTNRTTAWEHVEVREYTPKVSPSSSW